MENSISVQNNKAKKEGLNVDETIKIGCSILKSTYTRE